MDPPPLSSSSHNRVWVSQKSLLILLHYGERYPFFNGRFCCLLSSSFFRERWETQEGKGRGGHLPFLCFPPFSLLPLPPFSPPTTTHEIRTKRRISLLYPIPVLSRCKTQFAVFSRSPFFLQRFPMLYCGTVSVAPCSRPQIPTTRFPKFTRAPYCDFF